MKTEKIRGWVYGHNLPGHLPDTDEPMDPLASFDEAKRALIGCIMDAAEDASISAEHTLADALDELAQDVNLWAKSDASWSEHGPDGRIYWIRSVVDFIDLA